MKTELTNLPVCKICEEEEKKIRQNKKSGYDERITSVDFVCKPIFDLFKNFAVLQKLLKGIYEEKEFTWVK